MDIQKQKHLPFSLILCTVLGLTACQKEAIETANQNTNQKNGQQAIELIAEDIVQIKTGSLADKSPFTGTIQAVSQTSVQSQVSATAMQVTAEIGQSISKGQVLVRLNNQDNNARLAQANANLAATQAQAELNRSLVERKRRLWQQGFISKLEYEQSQVEYRAQAEQIKAEQANVNIAEKAAQDTVIRSPINGVITNRQVEQGQTISVGQTLFEIVDPSNLELKASLAVSEAYKLFVGQNIEFRLQGDTTLYPAKVTRVSPVADQASRNITFFARPTAQAPLHIGTFVEGSIIRNNNQQASGQIIPLNAIRHIDTAPFVWVIRDNKLLKVKVDVMQKQSADQLAIVRGLQNNDLVSLIDFKHDDINQTVSIKSQTAQTTANK
uniref:efflux RND transporter periplasmic adaptor subunit n=1 Tax=uncultured Acinetobacter sp. TaxID=165433 RepID=UPI002615248A|nr:efflux RND transporter periplasmic adaptor subunit [uncultured Acinetobacter sp.]